MAVRKIVSKSEMSLFPSVKVLDFNDRFIKQIGQDLLDTLTNQQEELDRLHPGMGGGVGLASNQIEYPNQHYPQGFAVPHMYVVSIRKERAMREQCAEVAPTVFINAAFIPALNTEEIFSEEGCLSIVGIQGLSVPRADSGTLIAFDQAGAQKELKIEGFIARVHQHELDHCAGKEYLNKIHFTDEELNEILNWINQNNKNNVILKNKLVCKDLKNVDLKALSVWVNNELAS